jgi:hypothetical protein
MHAFVLATLTLGLGLGAMSLATFAAPGDKPYASDAHRAGPGGYGGLKSRSVPFKSGVEMRGGARKEPYYYRYYSDQDRSPGSCRRYAQRAIATKNSNWWTRYSACLR